MTGPGGEFTIEHDASHIELPRALFGGLKKSAVEDLLRRVASDFNQLERENSRLTERVEELNSRSLEAGPREPDPQANPEVPALNGDGDPATAGGSPDPAEEQQGTRSPGESLKEPEELATAVLAVAQRAARELREATRLECELMLKKSREHALKFERELEQAQIDAKAQIDELVAIRSEMRDNLRASLQGLLRTFIAERSGDPGEVDWTQLQNILASPSRETGRKSKKKAKP